MSQLLFLLDVEMLQNNASVIAELIQQELGINTIMNIRFSVDILHIYCNILYQNKNVPNPTQVMMFFHDYLRIDVEVCGGKHDEGTFEVTYRILAAEVSEVTIKSPYNITTAQSILAAAVKEERVSIKHSLFPYLMKTIETISMPELSTIHETTTSIAWDKFNDDIAGGQIDAGEADTMTIIETRWVK